MSIVLVINGSPKGKESNTMKLVDSFLDGIIEENPEAEIIRIDLIEKDIKSCIGCYQCFKETPGICVLRDDMKNLLEIYEKADLVLWASPLYHFGITSLMKKFMERLLPEFLPFIDSKGYGVYGRPYRYPELMEHKKHILISTCGFPSTKENYEGVISQFDTLFGKGQWEKILCVEGELLQLPLLGEFTSPYLNLVKSAGKEYVNKKVISTKLKLALEKPFIEIETFLNMSNLRWGVDDPRKEESDEGLLALGFMKQMRVAFNDKIRKDMEAVLEFDFTDIKEIYQLVIKDNHCTLFKNDFLEATTRIKTHLNIWERISEGKIDPMRALLEKHYTVEGDFKMIDALVDGLFGSLTFHSDNKKILPVSFKNTPYWFILTMIPWVLSLIFTEISRPLAAIVPLLIAGIFNVIKKGAEMKYFDKATLLFFSLLTLLTISWGMNYTALTIAAIDFFGLFVIWIFSAIKTVPLTADYTQYFYGKNALKNSLFLKINRILTIVWSFIFLLEGLMSLGLFSLGIKHFYILIPQILLIPGILFSIWFSNWYPIHCSKPKE